MIQLLCLKAEDIPEANKLARLRGQFYDGCSTMAGAKAGIATMITELKPELCSPIVMGMHPILASVTPSNSHRYEGLPGHLL